MTRAAAAARPLAAPRLVAPRLVVRVLAAAAAALAAACAVSPAAGAPARGLFAGPVKPLAAPRPPRPAAWATGRVFGAPPANAPPANTAPANVAPADVPPPAAAREPATGACEAEIARAARRWGVPPAVLHAVGLTETGRKGVLSPYALNIDGATVFAGSAEAALRRFEQARRDGAKFIDLGCMQINHRWHGKAFASPARMLEPALNVDYAARFLKELRLREGSWTLAVARYNAGPDNNPAQKRYVCAVLGQLVRAGYGAWTDSARAFCAKAP